jgi:hypothetical protein
VRRLVGGPVRGSCRSNRPGTKLTGRDQVVAGSDDG